MTSKHKHPTISFRPSEWERALINERARLSGLNKKDFIVRSCIYSNIVMVGTKETAQRIVDELQEMEDVMYDIVGQIDSRDITLTEDAFEEMKDEYLALIITIVYILKGASYLFKKERHDVGINWETEIHSYFDEKSPAK